MLDELAPPKTQKAMLRDLIEGLSDYECSHLMSLFTNVTKGSRFWEGDVGILYNEYVKAHFFNIGRNTSNVVASGPPVEDGPFAPIAIIKSVGDADRVALPQPRALEAPFSEVVLNRRSRRNFSSEPLSLEDLSTLLHHGAGTTGVVSGYGYRRLPLRTFPSAGGLQSPELYVSIHDVAGVPPAIYHYHPLDHVLERIPSEASGQRLADFALGQTYLRDAPVVMLISGYYERLRWKYGERAYRYMCMDAGFMAENIHLASAAMGLGACAAAGFADDALERLIDVDGRAEMLMLLMGIGHPA